MGGDADAEIENRLGVKLRLVADEEEEEEEEEDVEKDDKHGS